MALVTPIATDQQDDPRPSNKVILGVRISDMTRGAAIKTLLASLAANHHRKLAFCNAHTANSAWSDGVFQAQLKNFTVLADGIGIDMAAKALYGAPFAANLNGTDFVPALLQAASGPLRLALIGGKPGVAHAAADKLLKLAPQHSISVAMDGFGSDDDIQIFVNQLTQQPVDILLVAMGNPKQELWIADNINARHAKLAIGVGALFDFLAGEVTRAPNWIRSLRLEWIYRLAQEPRRLFRRYVLGNPLFLLRIALIKYGFKPF